MVFVQYSSADESFTIPPRKKRIQTAQVKREVCEKLVDFFFHS